MATNSPEFPRMILSPRITKESFSVMLTNALSFSSLRSETLTSVISIMRLSPRKLAGGAMLFGGPVMGISDFPIISSDPPPCSAQDLLDRDPPQSVLHRANHVQRL